MPSVLITLPSPCDKGPEKAEPPAVRGHSCPCPCHGVELLLCLSLQSVCLWGGGRLRCGALCRTFTTDTDRAAMSSLARALTEDKLSSQGLRKSCSCTPHGHSVRQGLCYVHLQIWTLRRGEPPSSGHTAGKWQDRKWKLGCLARRSCSHPLENDSVTRRWSPGFPKY